MPSIFIFLIILIIFSNVLSKKKIIYLIRHGSKNFNSIKESLNYVDFVHCISAGEFLSKEKIGKIHYSPGAKQSAKYVANQHIGKVEIIEDPLINDISWGIYENKTYQEAFRDDKGGDFIYHPEQLIIPEGETFYSLMNRLRLFLIKFWESEETECTIVSHGNIINIFSLMFLQAPLEKFWSMYITQCGVSKVQMKSIYSFVIEYWNANYFQKEGEERYFRDKLDYLETIYQQMKK